MKKLKKYKHKILPIIFGKLISLTPILIISQFSNIQEQDEIFLKIKKEVSIYDLNLDSFEIIGQNGKGKIQVKKEIKIPSQVKIQYAKNSISNSELKFQDSLENLSADDTIHISFSIRTSFKKDYKFSYGFIPKISTKIIENNNKLKIYFSSYDLIKADKAKFNSFNHKISPKIWNPLKVGEEILEEQINGFLSKNDHLPKKNPNIKRAFKVKVFNKEKGELTIDVFIHKYLYDFSFHGLWTSFKIFGFKTNDDLKQEEQEKQEAYKLIEIDKEKFKSLKRVIKSKVWNPWKFHKIIKEEEINKLLPKNNPLPIKNKNIKRVFRVKSFNQETGEMIIGVKFFLKDSLPDPFFISKINEETSFKIFGFKTNSDLTPKENQIKELIKNEEEKFKSLTKTTKSKILNPWKVSSSITEEQINALLPKNNPLPIKNKNIKRVFRVKSFNQETGEMIIGVKFFLKDSLPDPFFISKINEETSFKIFGFKTNDDLKQEEQEKQEAYKLIEIDKEKFKSLKRVIKSKVWNPWKFHKIIKEEEINKLLPKNNPLPIKNKNIKRVFRVKSFNQETGEMIIGVKFFLKDSLPDPFFISKINEETSFKIFGFKTNSDLTPKENQIKELIKNEEEKFKSLKRVIKSKVWNSWISLQILTEEEINKLLPKNNPLPIIKNKGIKRFFLVKSFNQETGEMIIGVEFFLKDSLPDPFLISKINKKTSFKIFGFKTNSDLTPKENQIKELIKNEEEKFKSLKRVIKSKVWNSWISLQILTEEEINKLLPKNNPLPIIKNKGIKRFFWVKSFNQETGEMIIGVEFFLKDSLPDPFLISKINKKTSFKIFGFKTNSDLTPKENQIKELIKNEEEKFKSLKRVIKSKVWNPWKFHKIIKEEEINKLLPKNNPLPIIKNKGIKRFFWVKSFNQETGEMIIGVEFFLKDSLPDPFFISKINEETSFKIFGFKTNSDLTPKENQIKELIKNNKPNAIDEEKRRIEALSKYQIKKNVNIINANTLTKNELDLQLNLSKIKGFSYSISHPTFTINGDYDVKVDIKKDGQTATAIRKISIVGINKAKRKLSLQRSSGLSKGAIVGIVIGVLLFSVSISLVLIKFFKSKKTR